MWTKLSNFLKLASKPGIAPLPKETQQPKPILSETKTISNPITNASTAFVKPKRPVSKVFLHCSASDNPEHDDVSVMRKWHVEGNKWSDVGYHFFITKRGEIQRGRALEMVPAAQAGHNTGSIAICLHGLDKAKFTQAQYTALYLLCESIHKAYSGKVTFHGHREVAAKECPVFDYKAVLKLNDKGKMQA